MTVTQAERRYEYLAERIRKDIRTGKLQPGDRLPSEQKIAETEGIARGTVRRAIEALAAEGLIISQSGFGHTVRRTIPLVWRASDPERNTDTTPLVGPVDAWSRSVRSQGRTPSEDIQVRLIRADERIAGWLDVPPGEPLTVRQRVRYVDGEPYSTADSYYPRSIVAGTAVEMDDDVLPGIYAVFEQVGRPWVLTVDRIISRLPMRDEARTLNIPRGGAITEIVRRSFDADNIPIRLTLIVLPGDRHEIEYENKERAA